MWSIKLAQKLLIRQKQCVVVKNDYSFVKYLKARGSHYSVLGPLLFITYINDIVNNLESLTRLFAVDTVI
jgi:hypothetical protein